MEIETPNNPLNDPRVVSRFNERTRVATPILLEDLLLLMSIEYKLGESKHAHLHVREMTEVETEYAKESRNDLYLHKKAEEAKLRKKLNTPARGASPDSVDIQFRMSDDADSDSDVENTRRKEEKKRKDQTRDGRIQSKRRKKRRVPVTEQETSSEPASSLVQLPLAEEINMGISDRQFHHEQTMRDYFQYDTSTNGQQSDEDDDDAEEGEDEDDDELDPEDPGEKIFQLPDEEEEENETATVELTDEYLQPFLSEAERETQTAKKSALKKQKGTFPRKGVRFADDPVQSTHGGEERSILRNKKKPKTWANVAHKEHAEDSSNPLMRQKYYYPLPNPAIQYFVKKAKRLEPDGSEALDMDPVIPPLISRPRQKLSAAEQRELASTPSSASSMAILLAQDSSMDEQNFMEWANKLQNMQALGADSFIQTFVRQMPKKQKRKIRDHAVDLPIFSREYEESRLRQARSGEMSCARGKFCEGNNFKTGHRFTNVECPPPAVIHNPELRTEQAYLCVMCRRMKVQQNICSAHSEMENIKVDFDLAGYQNTVGKPGEYVSEQCYTPSSIAYQGLRAPVAMHQRSFYRQECVDGIWWWRQTGYVTMLGYDSSHNPYFG